MADRMAAEIWIGGKLRRRLLKAFPISDMRWTGIVARSIRRPSKAFWLPVTKTGCCTSAIARPLGEIPAAGKLAAGTQNPFPEALQRKI